MKPEQSLVDHFDGEAIKRELTTLNAKAFPKQAHVLMDHTLSYIQALEATVSQLERQLAAPLSADIIERNRKFLASFEGQTFEGTDMVSRGTLASALENLEETTEALAQRAAPTSQQILDAIQAMADEGWLLCGPEGLSPAQEKVVAILQAAPTAQGSGKDVPDDSKLVSVIVAIARCGIANDNPTSAFVHQLKRLAKVESLSEKTRTTLQGLIEWHENGRAPDPYQVVLSAAAPQEAPLSAKVPD